MATKTKPIEPVSPLWGYFFLLLFLAAGAWALSFPARGNHWLTAMGITLPIIKAPSLIYQDGRFIPADFKIDQCRGNGWKNTLSCNVSSGAAYIPGLTFEGFQFSDGGAIKIQEGRADMPTLEAGQTGRLTLHLDDINDVDSLVLWIAPKPEPRSVRRD